MRVFARSVALCLGLALPAASVAADSVPERLLLAVEEPIAGQLVSKQSVGYLCQLDVPYSQRWVPPILFIAHDPETGRVVISDPIALFHNAGLPVLGKRASETADRISFTWSYPVGVNAQQTRKMLYRASIDKASGRATVTAIPAGFDSVFQADGRCEAQPLEELSAQP
ncbi:MULTISPECIES: hypothetical protein [unclassified Salipiger]|uniref:hypothetical protein n=1 Tax=unclassified Salipiger TaxID=2640570 RepID=UPI0013BBF3D8|nr:MULTISPECIES: hypothetical protein [unclassified Salipiger]NDV51831.1 hypothetical protein [Salipiger sp. PrR003]NDW31004.1 hypothetical protein [Salipiger sp. PrR007]